VAAVAMQVMMKEFLKKVAKLTFPKPFQPVTKLSKRQPGGIRFREPFKISVLFFREPLIIHNTGYTIAKPKMKINI
jgi:hypothetical protein